MTVRDLAASQVSQKHSHRLDGGGLVEVGSCHRFEVGADEREKQ